MYNYDHGYILSPGLKEGRPGGLPLLISNGQGFKGSGLSCVDGFFVILLIKLFSQPDTEGNAIIVCLLIYFMPHGNFFLR